jgi:hypothetical protein
MLDHDALSFSLMPFCYGVCPFVNQLHPLPSAISCIPGDIQFTDFLTQCEKLLETDLIFWDFDDFLNHCAASESK